MTIQQIRYLEAIAREGSISKAAEVIYSAQSSLSTAIKEVEKEYNITIFERTSKGVTLTRQGEEFLADVRYVSNYFEYVNEKYRNIDRENMNFCISSHHHICGEEAFLKLITSMSYKHYRFGYLEGDTSFVLDNVESGKSDIGIIFFTESAKSILLQELRKRELVQTHIAYSKMHIYVNDRHPLVGRSEVRLAEIIPYPFVTYDNLNPNSGMFTISFQQWNKNHQNFYVSDRATAYSIIRSGNAYATGSGYLSPDERNNDIVSIPISDLENIEVCWLKKDKYALSEVAITFTELLKALYY